MHKNTKAICVNIRQDQYDKLHERNINVSGFIRDVIDDRMGTNTIIMNLSPELRLLYDQIVSVTPDGDADIEPYLREALKKMLDDKIAHLKKLQKTI